MRTWLNGTTSSASSERRLARHAPDAAVALVEDALALGAAVAGASR